VLLITCGNNGIVDLSKWDNFGYFLSFTPAFSPSPGWGGSHEGGSRRGDNKGAKTKGVVERQSYLQLQSIVNPPRSLRHRLRYLNVRHITRVRHLRRRERGQDTLTFMPSLPRPLTPSVAKRPSFDVSSSLSLRSSSSTGFVRVRASTCTNTPPAR